MRLPIHVEDISEIFVRVTLAEKPEYAVYNSGGETISMGDIASLVQKYLPDAQINFEKETGGRELSGNYMMDNSRLRPGVRVRPRALPAARARDHQRRAQRRGPATRRLTSAISGGAVTCACDGSATSPVRHHQRWLRPRLHGVWRRAAVCRDAIPHVARSFALERATSIGVAGRGKPAVQTYLLRRPRNGDVDQGPSRLRANRLRT